MARYKRFTAQHEMQGRKLLADVSEGQDMKRTRARAFRGRPGRSWYEIKDADGDAVDVFVYDAIDWIGVSAEDFVQDLAQVNASTINLRINSPGGDVFDGVAIANAVRNHSATVNTYVDGLAASIASIIALAGDTVTMAKGSFLMIHDPWAGVIGTAEDMRQTAGVLDKIRDQLQEIYVERSGLDADRVRQMMADETWMNADDAINLGFADSRAQQAAASAAFDLSAFAHVPDELTAGPREADQPSESDLERSLREAGLSRSQARAFVAQGKKALSSPRDADDEEGRSELARVFQEHRDFIKQIGESYA